MRSKMPLRAASRVPVDENMGASGAEEAGGVKEGSAIHCAGGIERNKTATRRLE